MSKFGLILTTAVLTAAVASLIFQRRGEAKFNARETQLLEQSNELSALKVEHERLLKLAAQPSAKDDTVELMKLHAEAETLKKRTAEMGRRQAVSEDLQRPRLAETNYAQLRQMAGSRPWEARDLGRAFGAFADAHQNQSPTNLDDLASYLAKFNATLPGTNQYEIIYHGSLDQLKGLPWGSIAVIRDQQPWPGPNGTMMRVYGFPDGHSQIVIDNLQPWLSEHVIASSATQ